MCTEEEVNDAIEYANPDIIMHTNSSYPTPTDELNLGYIQWLKDLYGVKREIGYSCHHYGIRMALTTLGMGITWIEKHVTIDRTLWGSDQIASIEPEGLFQLVKCVRNFEVASNGYGRRIITKSELPKRKSLMGK